MDDRENHLRNISIHLRDINQKASVITALMVIVAFFEGRAAVLQFGLWNLLGF